MNKIKATLSDGKIIIHSPRILSVIILKELTQWTLEEGLQYKYEIAAYPYNCFVISCLMRRKPDSFEDTNILPELLQVASNVTMPIAYIQGGNSFGIRIPDIPAYKLLVKTMGARNNLLDIWTVPLTRLYETYSIISLWSHPFLPKFTIRKELQELVSQKIAKKDNLENLIKTKLTDLYTVQHGYQIKPEGFTKLKYSSIADILLRRPTRYIDRSDIRTLKDAPYWTQSYVKGKINSISTSLNNKLKLNIRDDTLEEFEIDFFGGGWLSGIYNKDDEVVVSINRRSKNHAGGNEIINPTEVKYLPIAPVYRQAPRSKITTKLLTNCVNEIFSRFDGGDLFSYINGPESSFWELIRKLHFPKNTNEYSQTLDDLAFIELVLLQLLFLEKKENTVDREGVPKTAKTSPLMEEAIKSLPYELTNGQKNSIKQIIMKLRTNKYEDILLSGDVGSGKSNVAQSVCLYTVDSGYQAVLIGPTEILAKQLYDTFVKFIEPLENKPNIVYLSGNSTAREKKEIQEQIKSGEAQIIVGTHSVFGIEYNNLGLIVIDEQQKFGKAQREMLINSRPDGKLVDLLSQTATPIPRSTALAFYGDIDLITLTEKPNNRKENITKWIRQSTDEFLRTTTSEVWNHIFSEIEDGRQIFIVTPAVEEGSKMASVKNVAKVIENEFGDKIKIGKVHGGLKKESQNKIISQFRDKKFDVLIASSIIEVGMDIPNSTIIVVLDAERFGASSLHQIRGRVGRSGYQGYCYLVSNSESKSAERRLGALVDSNDGFQIALVDLETRREGDLLGDRQAGESNLIFCDLSDHSKIIDIAKYEANRIYNSEYRERALSDARLFLKKDDKEE